MGKDWLPLPIWLIPKIGEKAMPNLSFSRVREALDNRRIAQAEAQWQDALCNAGAIVNGAFEDMANDAFDLGKRGKAIAQAIQALEALSRQHDDITGTMP